MIDLSKLTPAPWESEGLRLWTDNEDPKLIGTFKFALNADSDETNCDFAALARNAFDVMMRRGWAVRRHDDQFHVYNCEDDLLSRYLGEANPSRNYEFAPTAADPFTALVMADAWMKEREATK